MAKKQKERPFFSVPIPGILLILLLIICVLLITRNSNSRFQSIIPQKGITERSKSNAITLIATGDIMLGRTVNFKTVSGDNFNWPFEKTIELLRSADITLINLEGTLPKKCESTMVGMRFCGDQRNIEGLIHAGVDIVNLANNHSGDFGKDGFTETLNLLTENSILVTGVDGPTYKRVNNINLAFLGYTDIPQYISVIPLATEERIKKEVQNAAENTDIVVTSFHFGVEYIDQPTKRQVDLAHLAIDSGADIVIGHHPHWIQPIEIYKDKPIIYSLGNFVFDQEWSQKTKEGNIVKIILTKEGVKEYELIPILIKDFGQPEIVSKDK